MHRKPPENANGACQGAAAEFQRRTEQQKNKRAAHQRQGRLRSWDDVAHLTDRLNLVADEKDSLLRRVRWAQLRMELGIDGVDDVDLDELVEEVEAFKSICRALSGRFDGAPAPSDMKEAA